MITALRLSLIPVLAALAILLAPAHAQLIDSEASHAVILDHATGEVLWSKNGDAEMIPASMTKMMTAHLVFERLRSGEIALTDTFTTSRNAWEKGGWASGGSTMGLAIGDQPTVAELLRGVIILSGNDACIVLAEGLAGSEEAFAEEMTRSARALGLDSASFRNVTGLNDPGHHISAIDLARLARHTISEFPEFYPLYAEPEYEWRGISQPNRNPLLGRMQGADGLKTGHLEASGYGLAASAERNGVRRIIVFNGMESQGARAREAERLMRLAFSSFETRTLDPERISLPALKVFMGERREVGLRLEEPVRLSAHKRAFPLAKTEIVYDGPIEAPVAENQTLAHLVITMDDEEKLRVPLLATENVPRLGFVSRALEGLRLRIEGDDAA